MRGWVGDCGQCARPAQQRIETLRFRIRHSAGVSRRRPVVELSVCFGVITKAQAFLHDVHISPYEQGNRNNHAAVRPRRLLLHKKELLKISQVLDQKGCTFIPLNVYLSHGLVKVEMGICKGKVQYDKRQDLKKKTADREAARAIQTRK